MLPKHLLYWINSFPSEACALVTSDADLQNGIAICELATFSGIVQPDLANSTISSGATRFKDRASTGIGRIRSVLIAMAEHAGGWNNLPASLRHADAAKNIVLYASFVSREIADNFVTDASRSDIIHASSSAHTFDKSRSGEELLDLVSYLYYTQTGKGRNECRSNETASVKAGVKENLSASLKQKVMRKQQQSILQRSTDDLHKNLHQMPPLTLSGAANIKQSDYRSLIDRDSGRDVLRASFPLQAATDGAKNANTLSARGRLNFTQSIVPGATSKDSTASAKADSDHHSVRSHSLTTTAMKASGNVRLSDSSFGSPRTTSAALAVCSDRTNLQTQYPEPSAEEFIALSDWLRIIGVQAPVPQDALTENIRNCDPPMAHQEHQFDLEINEWRNGIALSELAAIVVRTSGKSRQLVKQVSCFDNLGRPLRPRLLIAGTETSVTRKVQAMRNVRLALNAMRTNCEPSHLLLDVNPNPADVVDDALSIWGIVYVIYQRYGVLLKCSGISPTVNNYSVSFGTGYTKLRRARSVSPPASVKDATSTKAIDATIIDGERSQNRRSRSLSPQLRARNRVSFATHLQEPSPLRGNTHCNSRGTTGTSLGNAIDWDNNSSTLQRKPTISNSLDVIRGALQRKSGALTGETVWDSSKAAPFVKFPGSNKGGLGHKESNSKVPEGRFRTTFPEDQGLADSQPATEPESRAKIHRRETARKESELERLAARRHALKIRKSALLQAHVDMNREKLKQFAEDFIGSKTDDGADLKTSAMHERNVTDGANTATTQKKVLQQQHLQAIMRAARYSQLGLSKLRLLQQRSITWSPPVGDPAKVAALLKVPVAHVSARQIVTVREWMLSLGLSVLDGEGGYFYWDAGRGMAVHSYPAPPLPLALDRLRNGQLLCSLLHVLEPDAAVHANLAQLLHRSKASLRDLNDPTAVLGTDTKSSSPSKHIDADATMSAAHALENIERSLWVLKLRRSPPIPEHLLIRSDDILRGNKDVLWGLLWEVLQAYPYSNDWAARIEPEKPAVPTANKHVERSIPKAKEASRRTTVEGALPVGSLYAQTHDFGTFPILPYSARDRRKLDQSLAKYIHSLGLLKPFLPESENQTSKDAIHRRNQLAAAVPESLTSLETCIRDGTLLCALCEKALGLGLGGEGHGFVAMSWNRSPCTYQQCVGNLIKAVTNLRNIATGLHHLYRMSGRFLYVGCEEAIVRGNWDTILGLFEDIRRCADKVEPRPTQPRQLLADGEDNKGRGIRGNGYLADSSEWPYFGPLGSYSQNTYRWDGKTEMLTSNLHFLANRQYVVHPHVTSTFDTDAVPEVVVSEDADRNASTVDNRNMRMPARLDLNPLQWRGEEINRIGGHHTVDLIPRAASDNSHISDDITLDSVDRMYTRDEMKRKIRDPDTGIEVATDMVTVISETRGQQEMEEEFRALHGKAGVENKAGHHFAVDATGNVLALGQTSIYPSDDDKLKSMKIHGSKTNRTSSAEVMDTGDNWKFKKIHHGNVHLESSITLSPHRTRSPTGAGKGENARTAFVQTNQSSMRVQNVVVAHKTSESMAVGYESKAAYRGRDPRRRGRANVPSNSVYDSIDVTESYPGKTQLIVGTSKSRLNTSHSPPRSPVLTRSPVGPRSLSPQRVASPRRPPGTPQDAAEDVFIRSSFHLSPTPLTPVPTGWTPPRGVAQPPRDATNYYGHHDDKQAWDTPTSHIYAQRGTDYDDSASNISNSPGEIDKPAEVEVVSDDSLSVRNTIQYRPDAPLNNRDNNRSKINPFYSLSPKTAYLALPSANYENPRDPVSDVDTRQEASSLGGSSDGKDWFEKSSRREPANPNPATQISTAISERDQNIIRTKPSTMILSNAAPSIRGHIADIVEMTRLRKAAVVIRWLQDIGVLAKDIKMVNMSSNAESADIRSSVKGQLYRPSALEILATFRDGVMLCRLVEALEYCATLPGTTASPKSSAQKLQNIKRALEKIGSSSGKMPPSQLMCAEEILAGKTDIILSLLERLHKVYKIRTM